MTDVIATNQTILVVGGGISGVTAALEAAECGKDVVLIEKNATLGGRTTLLYRYFPKLCHPTCGFEINLRRIKSNPRQKARGNRGEGGEEVARRSAEQGSAKRGAGAPPFGDATVEPIMGASQLPILRASSGSDPQRGPSSALRRAPPILVGM